jgi:hypothetical protein
VRGGGALPEKAITAFPWPIQAAVWLWSMPVAHVIHLCRSCGSTEGVVVRTAKGAARRRRDSSEFAYTRVTGSIWGAMEAGHTRRAWRSYWSL